MNSDYFKHAYRLKQGDVLESIEGDPITISSVVWHDKFLRVGHNGDPSFTILPKDVEVKILTK